MAEDAPGISWSELNEARKAVRRRWPSIWRLPRVGRSTRYAAARIRPGQKVLDVGASVGGFGAKLGGVAYQTVDVDPGLEVDYRSLDEVEPGSVDVAVCFEMIEHVTLEDALAVARGIARALKPGGRLFLSTPNVHHPWSYLRSATHVTPFCYDELGGVLTVAGLAVDGLFRCHHDSVVKGFLRHLAYPLYRVLGIDHAKSILAVAHRPDPATRSEN
ncbi:MAG: class I SAM-dependent methyltransferase [Planctomycetota bacterium]